MRIDRIKAEDFGKLRGELRFAPGMTVVTGSNEAGKSTWLQAVYAGLCGRRRGRGSGANTERHFEHRYAPWNGGPWRAAVELERDDGRRIEILQKDLRAKAASAFELATRRSIEDEMQFEGSADGSTLLGLNRRIVPSVLFIAQNDIQRPRQPDSDEASALRTTWEEAAASASGAATAERALGILSAYARDRIGQARRGTTKGLQRAIDAETAARRRLTEARTDHEAHRKSVADLQEARREAAAREAEAKRWRKALAASDLATIDEELSRIRSLQAEFPDGAPPATSTLPDAAIASELREALALYRNRPPAPAELEGPAAAELEARLLEPAVDVTGDAEPASSVAAAVDAWRAARAGVALAEQHDATPAPAALLDPKHEPAIRGALAAIEQPEPDPQLLARAKQQEQVLVDEQDRLAEATGRRPARHWAIAAVIGSLVGLLAMIDLLPRPVGVVGFLVMGLALLVDRRLRRGRPRIDQERAAKTPLDLADARADRRDRERSVRAWRNAVEPARQTLERLGVEPTPDGASAALDRLAETRAWLWRKKEWQRRLDAVRDAHLGAEGRLRTELARRGVDDPDRTVEELLNRYEDLCRRNREQRAANERRENLRGQFAARRDAERNLVAQKDQRKRIEQRFAKALHAAGRPDEEEGDAEAWATCRLRELEEDRTAMRLRWNRLADLLAGRTLEEVEAERGQFADRLEGLSAGLENEDEHALFEATLDRTAIQGELQDVDARLREIHKKVYILTGQLKESDRLTPLAELEEQVEATERERRLLEEAARIVRLTRDHLETARDRVHERLAPELASALSRRLSRITDGRYADAAIDPQKGMEVRILTADGEWRAAADLSHGAADQVYLLLRVGLAETLGNRHETAPLFLDDATVHCDAERTRGILDLLLDLSEERQIVFFSQEDEVREWASDRLTASPRHRLIALGANGLPVAAT